MKYVALLRGINVGGNSKVEMKRLKAVFEKAGMHEVQTYINSGNVIFEEAKAAASDTSKIASKLEKAIASEFGFVVRVLVKSLPEMKKIVGALHDSWATDKDQRCDIIFLWPEFDSKAVLKGPALKWLKPDIDTVVYVKGALIWRFDRKHATKSGMPKIIGSALYKNSTARNCNTGRKLLAMMTAKA